MTLQEIYDLSLELGIKADPRGEKEVKRLLKKVKKEYFDLPEKKKKYFDKETFVNPYADTRMLWGDVKTKVKRTLVGIDTDSTEILLADRLSQKGTRIDVVIGHHPIGISLLGLNDVMDIHVDAFAEVGVPVNVVDDLIKERSEDIKRKVHPSNHSQTVDTARLLEMPLMNLHTVWDNMGDKFMRDYFKNKKFDNVGEIVEYMMEIPEYQEAARIKNKIEIVSGSEKSRTGKVAVFFTGGTNPSKEAFKELAKAGVGTLIDMHIPEDSLKELKKLHVNVINAGHMASDSIGANLFLDEIERKGVEVVPASGLIRVKRKK